MAVAAENPESFAVYDLGEMIVTTHAPGVRDISPTQTITSEQIESYGAKTVVDALRHARGIAVTTGRRNQPEINMRGFSQEKILLLIDGVPYYETNYGKLNLDQIPADIISKIEIVQGTSSVLYGSNALGGVINIITKSAGEKMATQAFTELGNYGNYRIGVSSGATIGKFNYWVNAGREYQKGFRMAGGYDVHMGTINVQGSGSYPAILEDGGRRNNSDQTVNNFWGRLGFTPNENGEYFANIAVMNSERGMPPDINSVTVNPGGNFSNFNRFKEYNDIGLDLSGRQKIGNLTLSGKLFYHQHKDNFESYWDQAYQQLIATSIYKDYFYGVTVIANYAWGAPGTTHISFHFREDSHKERDTEISPYTETKSQTGSIGLQHDVAWTNWLFIIGTSMDWFDIIKTDVPNTGTGGGDLYTPANTKTSFNPMAGISYLFNNGRVYASLAHKTRFPILQHLYAKVSGNPELKPEETMNYVLGAEYTFFKQLTLSASGFWYDVKNLIDRPDRNSRYQNYGNARILGFDVVALYQPFNTLSFSVDFTYNYGRNTTDGRLTNYVVRVPEYKLNTSVNYLIPYIDTQVDLNFIWVGSIWTSLPTPGFPTTPYKETRPFWITDIKVSKTFLKHFKLYAELGNIFDNEYESDPGFPNPGRNFVVGLKGSF